MDNIKNNPKILFIPGWLDTGERNGFQNSLDIWNKKIDINHDFKVDYVVAHSVGSLVALSNWQKYQNFKIILVNPVIEQKGSFRHWVQFMRCEGVPGLFIKAMKPSKLILSFFKILKFFKTPACEIIDFIPPSDLLVFYGEKDKYLFNHDLIKFFKEKGFRATEVKGAGHNYDSIINKEVLKEIH